MSRVLSIVALGAPVSGCASRPTTVPTRKLAELYAKPSAFEAIPRSQWIAESRHACANREGIDRTGFRTILNTHPDSRQTVHHLHIHVLGGRKMDWADGFTSSPAN